MVGYMNLEEQVDKVVALARRKGLLRWIGTRYSRLESYLEGLLEGAGSTSSEARIFTLMLRRGA